MLLPALVTLTLGGIGLIRRRLWGYYAHLAGSVLVGVTCFGLFYTIPALLSRLPGVQGVLSQFNEDQISAAQLDDL